MKLFRFEFHKSAFLYVFANKAGFLRFCAPASVGLYEINRVISAYNEALLFSNFVSKEIFFDRAGKGSR